MMNFFAVHKTFDCMDYNEHHYFATREEAEACFSEFRNKIKESELVKETYTDTNDTLYVQYEDGSEKIYLEEIYIPK
jgi:hypothetical protein